MKKETQIREALIENTIYLIAQGGFEMATTRNIAKCGANAAGLVLNDAYIYRIFGSKEGLYAEAFALLNEEIFSYMCRGLDNAKLDVKTAREDLRVLWMWLWRFILNNETRSRAFVRYYYSIYLREASLRRHRECFNSVVVRVSCLFKEEADVTAIMHNVLTSTFNFAIRVFNGDLDDDDVNVEHMYNVLYNTISSYLKEQ